MRIAVITSGKYQTNGISTVIDNLYANDVFNKESITFIFPTGSSFERIEILKSFGYKVLLLERNSNPIRYYFQLKKILNEGRFDIVHVNGNSATNTVELLAAKKAKIPVRIMHNHNTRCSHPIINSIFKPFLNSCCNVRFACSEEAGKFLFGKRSCTVINNGFNVVKYKYDADTRNQLRKQFNISNQIVIGHVGVFNYQKNHEFLLNVFFEYKKMKSNAVLVLMGDGGMKAEIQAQAERLGLIDSVVFTGNRADIHDLLNMLDVFVFPSRFEGLGIAPIEAQANGLPVVASNRVPEMAKVNNNFLFLPLESGEKAWSEEIYKLELRREEDGCKNVALAGFDIQTVVMNLYKTYEELMEINRCK